MANTESSAKMFRPWETSTPVHTTRLSPSPQHKPVSVENPKVPVFTHTPVRPSPIPVKPTACYSLPLPVPAHPYCYPYGFQWSTPTTTTASPVGNESGYHSEQSPPDLSAKGRSQKQRRNLNPAAVTAMERWYELHRDHPYPSDEVINLIARTGNITTAQVRKWMANKRVRSHNTLSYNQASLVRRGGRTRKELYPGHTQPDSTTHASERTLVSIRPTPYPIQHPRHTEASRAGLPSYNLPDQKNHLSLLTGPTVPCHSPLPVTASPPHNLPYTHPMLTVYKPVPSTRGTQLHTV